MGGSYLGSSIGKKQVMALSGLAWCGFVFGHMVGNLLYLVGPDAYNAYGHAITNNKPVYYAIETVLLLTFCIHILFAILVVLDNRRARPVAYAVSPQGGEKTAASFASLTMKYSGAFILAFVVLHLITFRFGSYYPYGLEGKEVRDLHKLITEVFSGVGYVGWYLFCLLLMAFHLSHALWSSLQTMGWIPVNREKFLRKASMAFGWIVAIGFAVTPVFVFFTR